MTFVSLGSIRIPALCCGIYGFKPSTSRVPYGGQKDSSVPGMDFLLPSAGPMSTDINALEVFMAQVINSRPAKLDATAIDVPWRFPTGHDIEKLRIGVLPEDPRFQLHPTVKHTLAEAIRRLAAQGHVMIPLDQTKCHIADATETAWKFFMIDDAAYRHVEAGGEPLLPSVVYTHNMARNLDDEFIPKSDLKGCDRLSQLAIFRTKRALICDDWRKIWTENNLDLVLAPSAQSTAVQHDRFGLPPYTTLTNVLDVSML